MRKRVSLNVGGVWYDTTRETLLSRNSQFFERALCDEETDSLFIDRDGLIFAYILNFMRNGMLIFPDEDYLKRLLICEAKFFELEMLLETMVDPVA